MFDELSMRRDGHAGARGAVDANAKTTNTSRIIFFVLLANGQMRPEIYALAYTAAVVNTLKVAIMAVDVVLWQHFGLVGRSAGVAVLLGACAWKWR